MRRTAELFVACCLLFISSSAMAYVMSSSNYRIQQDSVNIGGIDNANSASYRMKDTLGEIGTGFSSSGSYNLHVGYRQMDEVYISISAPNDVTLSPDIGGITGGIGDGSAVWDIITDNPAGYSLTIKASSLPALRSGSDTFADYTTAGGVPDFNWSVNSTDSEFGFTPEGGDIVQKYRDNGSDTCGTGASETANSCWHYLSTATETISQSSSANHPSGVSATVRFRAESGSSHVQLEGAYTATITVTAITL